MSAAQKSFTAEEQQQIIASIKEAERLTSGEIRLFIESTCKEDVLDRSAYIFKELKMHETAARNGVLIYLALTSHKFAIIGDTGINSKVEKDFWLNIKTEMQGHFVGGDFVAGLNKGIRMIGEALQQHFPYHHEDKNELPDDIVFGKE